MSNSFPSPLPADCRKVRTGDASLEEAFVAAHLAECPSCRQEMETMHHLEETLRALPEVAPPDNLLERIMANVEETAPPVAVPVATVLPFRRKFLSVAAAIALLALGASFFADRFTGLLSPSGSDQIAATSARRNAAQMEPEHGVQTDSGVIASHINMPEPSATMTTSAEMPLEKPGLPSSINANTNVSESTPLSESAPSASRQETASSSSSQTNTTPLPAESSELAVVPPGEVYNDPVSNLVGF